MSLVSIRDLTFAYPGNPDSVFEDLSVEFDTSWRLGLTGRNGRGKTTLLRLLAGSLTEYRGTISGVPPCVCFPAAADPNAIVIEAARSICDDVQDWQIERELSLIGLDDSITERKMGSLSGGERTKVLLAALFAQDGSFPLIDEPTNHLDAEGRSAAARYLRTKRGFILVSHDRSFLDSTVDHILSINRSDVSVCRGSFSDWLEEFHRTQESELAENARLKKDIGRLKDASKRARQWSGKAEQSKRALKDGQTDRGFISHRAAKMTRRAKSMEGRMNKAAEEKSALLQNLEKTDDLHLPVLRHPKDVLLRLSDVVPSYGGADSCAPLSFTLRRGDRLFLSGPNGCGKSSILKTILGEHDEYRGELQKASGLIFSSVPQDTSDLRGTLDDFAAEKGVSQSLFLAIAHKLGVDKSEFSRDISALSEGQRKKILLARSLCEPAHVYVWDEPLNYIDVFARMQIENMLLSTGAALLLVEHDQAFCSRIAAETVQMQRA